MRYGPPRVRCSSLRLAGAAAFAVVATSTSAAPALDKQGSAHGGTVESEESTHFDVEGTASLGVSLYNPSYAARPDNSGLALLRYALHLDVDLLGRKLSVPIDVNSFTDRTQHGPAKLTPSELDVIGGLTSTWRLGPGALEVGSRVEHDAPADRKGTAPGFTQTYVDARARYLLSLSTVDPRAAAALANGDLSGWMTLGLFAVNPTYAARPDNSGIALVRYGAHVELSILGDRLALGLDATMFTDRDRPGAAKLVPSELDATPEIVGRLAPFELHLAYERDMPVDSRGSVPGYSQSFVYALLAWGFDLVSDVPVPAGERWNVPR